MDFLKKLKFACGFFSMFFLISSLSLATETTLYFDIIIPINQDYDDYPLKKLDDEFMKKIFETDTSGNLKTDAISSNLILKTPETVSLTEQEYQDYWEIFTTYYPNYANSDYTTTGKMLVDSDGYYYPTLTLAIGGGTTEELITISLNLEEYYLIESTNTFVSGNDTSASESTIPYARIYSTQVNVNNYNGTNIKYEISYRSYNTIEDVDGTHNVYHKVTSSDGYNNWLRFEDNITGDTAYTAVVNALSRVYHTLNPIYDSSIKEYIWPYYQDMSKLQIIPLSPKEDGDYFTIVTKNTHTEITSFSLNNTDNYDVLIKGKVLDPNTIYFDFIKTGTSSLTSELSSVKADIYMTDGDSSNNYEDSVSGTPILTSPASIPANTGFPYTFEIYADYNDLLAGLRESKKANEDCNFDIALTANGERVYTITTDDGNTMSTTQNMTASLILDNISLPTVTVNSARITNKTTQALWTSLGMDEESVLLYSTTTFSGIAEASNLNGIIPFSNITITGDGHYAKSGDEIFIDNLEYITDPSDMEVEGEITTSYLYMNDKKTGPLTGSGSFTYKDATDSTFFQGNGIVSLYFEEGVANIFPINLLYVDNLDPFDEVASTTKQYINGGSYTVYYTDGSNGYFSNKVDHSSSEDGRGKDYSETDPTIGYTGTRAYIDIFSYKPNESDAPHGSISYTDDGVDDKDDGYIGENCYKVSYGDSYDISPIDTINHTNDGGYHILKVMAIDKAGNVETTDKTDLITIITELSTIYGNRYDYYIDTVNPVLNTSLVKSSDYYSYLNQVFQLPAALPFKNGDIMELNFSVNDYNPDIYDLSESGTVNITNSYSFPYTGASPLTFTVTNLTTQDSGNGYPLFTLTATDKAGNSSTEPVTGRLLNTIPSQVSLQLFEDHWNWVNSNTGITGNSSLTDPTDSDYAFSKGATTSNSSSPDIYITGANYSAIDNDSNDGNNVIILGVNIEGNDVYYNHGGLSPGQSSLNLTDINTNDSGVDGFYLIPNSKNTVKAVPYGPSGVKGFEYSKKVLVDTMVNSNTTLVSNGTYLTSTEKYSFDLDFSKISEFAGLAGYKINRIESKTGNTVIKTYDNSGSSTYTSLSTVPSTILTTTSGLTQTLELSKTDVIPGSRSKLFLDVIDSLGSEREIEFTLLIPEPSLNLKAKTANSNKIRETSIKVVGESSGNKGFGINSVEEKGE